jgi:capsular polysaccharide biosynthesis protein
MTTDSSSNYDDEIDLRAIALTLWKARKVILIATLAAAVVAFAVSFWILPHQYQATSYVFVGQPAIEFSKSLSDTGLTISLTLPDLTAVAKLSTAPKLLESVLNDPAVVAVIGNGKTSISISNMTDMVTAVIVGKDQLSLQVTDTDPQRAALLANTWAEKVVVVLNATYGLGTVAQTLDSQVLQSQQNYKQAQAALEDAVSKSQVNALNAQLNSTKADLDSVLGGIIRSRRVLDDLQFFEQGLSGLSSETPLILGDGLALTTLRQRSLTAASGSSLTAASDSSLTAASDSSLTAASDSSLTVASEGFTVQIDSASFAGFTVSKALESVTQMRIGLQAQLTRLQSDQSRLEQKLPQLQRDLENASAQLEQFTMKRDQSQGLYADLLQIQQQVITVLAQSSKVASVSVKAVPSQTAVSRNVLVNTAIFGMLGLMLAVFWTLLQNWWRNSDDKEKGEN